MANAEHNHASAQINRRSLLAALPAVVAAPALSGEILPPLDETPVMRLFREWEEMYRYQNSDEAGLIDDEDFNALCDERHELEQRIWGTRSQDVRDVLVKVITETNFGFNGMPDDRQAPDFWAEARALIG